MLADTPVKPRPKVGPVPRQSERGKRSARSVQDAAQDLRDLRIHHQRAVEIETYRTAFKILDADGSGKVEPFEVLAALKRIGKKVDDQRFWEVFRDCDLDNSSSLDFDVFKFVMDTLAHKPGPNAGLSDSVSAVPH